MSPALPALMTAPPLPLGQGAPGDRLAQAFQAWPQAPGSLTSTMLETWHHHGSYVLPWAWRALAAGTGVLATEAWQSHIHDPTPMGPWCPAALLLLSHENGGRLGLDLDPTPGGEWLVWWEDSTHVARLASSWHAVAELVETGPAALAAACHHSWNAPTGLASHLLNDDPLIQTWVDQRPLPGQAWCLPEAGQAIEKDCLNARHPRHPIFWTQP